ncbi:helix-turn-helix domain-containing protein [Mycoplasma corogypsi]
MIKLANGGNVTTDVLIKICEVLDCDISDIEKIVKEEK